MHDYGTMSNRATEPRASELPSWRDATLRDSERPDDGRLIVDRRSSLVAAIWDYLTLFYLTLLTYFTYPTQNNVLSANRSATKLQTTSNRATEPRASELPS